MRRTPKSVLDDDEKIEGSCIHRGMQNLLMTFRAWILRHRAPICGTGLLEVSDHFPTKHINQLFDIDLSNAVRNALANGYEFNSVEKDGGITLKAPSHIRQSFEALHGMNWVAYISGSLRNAGVPNHDLDEEASQIALQLLRGKLFSGWNGQSPLEARFRVAVKNAVSNVRRRRRKEGRGGSLEDVSEIPHRPPVHDASLEEFKRFILKRLGKEAVDVLQHLLDGGEAKDLVGKQGLTSYRVKKIVRELKEALVAYGASDPEFAWRIKRAVTAERNTLTKRFGEKRRP